MLGDDCTRRPLPFLRGPPPPPSPPSFCYRNHPGWLDSSDLIFSHLRIRYHLLPVAEKMRHWNRCCHCYCCPATHVWGESAPWPRHSNRERALPPRCRHRRPARPPPRLHLCWRAPAAWLLAMLVATVSDSLRVAPAPHRRRSGRTTHPSASGDEMEILPPLSWPKLCRHRWNASKTPATRPPAHPAPL